MGRMDSLDRFELRFGHLTYLVESCVQQMHLGGLERESPFQLLFLNFVGGESSSGGGGGGQKTRL